ncbi:hypothetical protein SAY86_013903 [Trapa natans]|uniref:Uncharacterized protein n=1 Tax=Trapa natans TaxID=22666 RepID=A0AAN7QQ91_TRANT|nr:hypothetical protein SAY86_013903 [Trapa natans]
MSILTIENHNTKIAQNTLLKTNFSLEYASGSFLIACLLIISYNKFDFRMAQSIQITGRINPPCLATKAVQSPALPLQGVDNVHCRDSFPASVLGVGNGVANDILQEDLEYPARLLVDQATYALDAPSAGEAADGRFGDSLNVIIAPPFPMPLPPFPLPDIPMSPT